MQELIDPCTPQVLNQGKDTAGTDAKEVKTTNFDLKWGRVFLGTAPMSHANLELVYPLMGSAYVDRKCGFTQARTISLFL